MTEAPRTIVCGNCGSIEDLENLHCSRCTRPLLVDLHLEGGALDEKGAFQAARALSLLGRPAPAFKVARERFQDGDEAIAPGVAPAFARRAIEHLAAEGFNLVMRPHVSGGSGAGRLGVVIGAVLLLFLASGGLIAWVGSRPAAAPEAPRTPVATAPDPARPAGPTPAGEASPPTPLSLTEIGRRVMPGVAHLDCDGVQGAGFFIDGTTLITNAHVACAKGRLQRITLADGRKILGDTLWRDEWMDLASIRVVGADASPLELGDATTLEAGETCAFVGSPRGLSFSLNEAKLSHVGREHLGLAYLQFDGTVNPGNSGGPLLDDQGRVVAVVSLMVKDAAGIGLALPIHYLPEGRDRLTGAEAVARWEALLEHTEQAAKERAPLFELEVDEPLLVGFRPDGDGQLSAILARRFPGDPEPARHTLEAVVEGEVTCTFQARVERWLSVEESLEESEHRRELLYLQKQEAGSSTFFGAGRVEVEACEEVSSRVFQGGLLRLREAAERSPEHRIDSSLRVGLLTALRARDRAQHADVQDERSEALQERVSEQQWRRAFTDAYAQLDRIEARHAQADALVARLDAKAATFQLTADGLKRHALAKEQLARSKEQLKAARDHLSRLERTASQQSIPRHWRRRPE